MEGYTAAQNLGKKECSMRLPSALVVSLSLLLSSVGLATADTRITSEERTQLTMGDQERDTTTEATLWFGEDRAVRVTTDGRMISRLDVGEAYLINDAQESYTVIKLERGGPPPTSPPSVKRSGETRQIGSWSAERYDLDFEVAPGETGHAVLWMSTDVDVDLDVYRAYARSVARAMNMSWLQSLAALEGYPVLQEMTVGPVRVTTQLVSIAEETPPAGLYDPPADYERKE
jgi:hypothetical protein